MARIIKIIPSGFWMSKNEHEFCFQKSLLFIEM